MIYTFKMFNTGQITLPKNWRNRFKTRHFIGEETKEGLLIKPIKDEDEEAVFYDNKEETGVFFPKGIDPQKLIEKIKEIHG